MKAPHPRVEDAHVQLWAADECTPLDRADPDLGRVMSERNALARDLQLARVEVGRLTRAMTLHADAAERSGLLWLAGNLRAALGHPTTAPTEGRSNEG